MRHIAENIEGIYHGSLVFGNSLDTLDAWLYEREKNALVDIEKVLVVGKNKMEIYIPSRRWISKENLSPSLSRTALAFGEEAMKQQFAGLTSYIPEDPVTVGDTWTQETEVSVLMPMIIETEYSVRAVDGTTVTLDLVSKISANPEAEFMDFDLFQLGYYVEGEQEGEIRVDRASGLSSSLTRQSMSGEMVMAAEDEEFSIPISVESTTRIEFIKEE